MSCVLDFTTKMHVRVHEHGNDVIPFLLRAVKVVEYVIFMCIYRLILKVIKAPIRSNKTFWCKKAESIFLLKKT